MLVMVPKTIAYCWYYLDIYDICEYWIVSLTFTGIVFISGFGLGFLKQPEIPIIGV